MKEQTVINDATHLLTQVYSGLEDKLAEIAQQPIGAIRWEQWNYFKANGVPTIKHEDWKYMPIERWVKNFPFEPYDGDELLDAPSILPDFAREGNTLFLFGGKLGQSNLSEKLKTTVHVSTIREMAIENPNWLAQYWGKISTQANDSLAALNTAFATDGIVIWVKKSAVDEIPELNIRNIFENTPEDLLQSRILLVMEPNTQLRCTYWSGSQSAEGKDFLNQVVECFLADGAQLDVVRFQEDAQHVASINWWGANIGANARAHIHTTVLGGGCSRYTYIVNLDGKGADASITGLHIQHNQQIVDARVVVNHNMPLCTSNQLFKTMVAQHATAAFSGKIFVARDAQQTNAYQSNKNMVLSPTANAYSKPQLEIYADDVKCSHGSTTGQLNDEALFYLRARGISEKNARKLLLLAFAEDTLAEIPESSFKTLMSERIEHKLTDLFA